MEVLSEAMNTYGAAIQELLDNGFRVRAETESDQELTTWIAETPEIKIQGSTPLVVLGLAAVSRSQGSSWRQSKRELYDRAMDGESLEPRAETP